MKKNEIVQLTTASGDELIGKVVNISEKWSEIQTIEMVDVVKLITMHDGIHVYYGSKPYFTFSFDTGVTINLNFANIVAWGYPSVNATTKYHVAVQSIRDAVEGQDSDLDSDADGNKITNVINFSDKIH